MSDNMFNNNAKIEFELDALKTEVEDVRLDINVGFTSIKDVLTDLTNATLHDENSIRSRVVNLENNQKLHEKRQALTQQIVLALIVAILSVIVPNVLGTFQEKLKAEETTKAKEALNLPIGRAEQFPHRLLVEN